MYAILVSMIFSTFSFAKQKQIEDIEFFEGSRGYYETTNPSRCEAYISVVGEYVTFSDGSLELVITDQKQRGKPYTWIWHKTPCRGSDHRSECFELHDVEPALRTNYEGYIEKIGGQITGEYWVNSCGKGGIDLQSVGG